MSPPAHLNIPFGEHGTVRGEIRLSWSSWVMFFALIAAIITAWIMLIQAIHFRPDAAASRCMAVRGQTLFCFAPANCVIRFVNGRRDDLTLDCPNQLEGEFHVLGSIGTH